MGVYYFVNYGMYRVILFFVSCFLVIVCLEFGFDFCVWYFYNFFILDYLCVFQSDKRSNGVRQGKDKVDIQIEVGESLFLREWIF